MNEIKTFLVAAGIGSRLKPLTDIWPKCMMPIRQRPLLEYWLGMLQGAGIEDVLVNCHHHAEVVQEFLAQDQFKEWVNSSYEESLLGTAGSVRANSAQFLGCDLLLAHADNWCCCNLSDFINYHQMRRPAETQITMMTFDTDNPSSCGIVELDQEGVVIGFHEKVQNPPGRLANAAVYILSPEVIEWVANREEAVDFSLDVLPHFLGKIATWKNDNIHRDIGQVSVLKNAQKDRWELPPWSADSNWQSSFLRHPIQTMV
jgi:mannose-1-phosphate guanylyltransferase